MVLSEVTTGKTKKRSKEQNHDGRFMSGSAIARNPGLKDM